MVKENAIVHGTIWKEVLRFFLPLTLGAFFQHFYSVADTIIVGRFLGTLELSAVGGSAAKLITFLANFFLGVSIGVTVICSQCYGVQNWNKLKAVLANGLMFFSLAGMGLALLGYSFAEELLLWMKTPIDTMEYAHTYLRTYLAGIVFCILYNLLSGVLRSFGDSRTPLYVLLFCSLLNIFLDVIFIIFGDLHVLGIALATVFSQAISALILLYIVYVKYLPLQIQHFSWRWDIIREICYLGLPAGLQSTMFSLSNIVVQSGVNSFGALSVASWSLYGKLDNILDIFVGSLGGTAITFVGQNYGAGKMERVKTSVHQIIIISYVLVSVLVALFLGMRYQLLALFTTEEEVIAIGAQLTCVILPMYLLNIPQQIYSQALRGLGISLMPMLLSIFGVVGVRLFWVEYLLPLQPSLSFLGFCYPVSALVMSLIFACYYYYSVSRIKSGTLLVETC